MYAFLLPDASRGVMMRRYSLIALPVFVLACDDTSEPSLVPPPTNLFYTLEVSGYPEDPPPAVLWQWDPVTHPDLDVYHVYSRPPDSDVFGLRAATTSTTFHDRGVPDLEYFVVAVDVDGAESGRSNAVEVDERLRLEAPEWLVSTSLNGAIHLAWADNAFTTAPDGFSKYHVYSASYSLDTGECSGTWGREGTTVAPEFLAGALPNGDARCFGVSAESIEGWESFWSPVLADTPRPDARNVIVWAHDVDPARSGFRFFLDGNGDGQASALELGIVADGGRTDIDFRLERDGAGDFWFTPVRSGTQVAFYDTEPIADLTSIDVAPETGYDVTPVQAVPRVGYVFQMTAGDAFARFGAIRVTHVGGEYVIFDWSYQTDPGNPQLSVGADVFVASSPGIIVRP